GFLPALSKNHEVVEQLLNVIQIKSGLRGSAFSNKVVHHGDQRRVAALQVRGQQGQKMVIPDMSKEVLKTAHTMRQIKAQIANSMPTGCGSGRAAAREYRLRHPGTCF